MQSDAALADQRALLEQERATLGQRLSELGFGGSGSLAFDQNFADFSQVTAERAEVEALATSVQDALDEVEDALRRNRNQELRPLLEKARDGLRAHLTAAEELERKLGT